MLVVLAPEADPAARALVDAWRPAGARLVTPRDLSREGWQVRPSAPAGDIAVVEGVRTPTREIRGVLTLMPCVSPADLPWVTRADREYVAQEMTAFLLAWLTALECAVINRPTPTGLWGPFLARERWAHLARGAGLEVAPHARETDVVVTVAGERCVGAERRMHEKALALARSAGVDVLAVRFTGEQGRLAFVDAQFRACVHEPQVADLLLERLCRAPL